MIASGGEDAVALAVLGQVDDAPLAARPAAIGGATGSAVAAAPPCPGAAVRPAIRRRAIQVRPAPISPARPRISPCWTRELAEPGPALLQACARRGRRRPWRQRRAGAQLVADHQPHQLALRQPGDLARRDQAPVAHDGDAVGDGEDLLQAVRDVEDEQAARLQRADDAEELLLLGQRQHGGRLVEDEDAGVGGERRAPARRSWRSATLSVRDRARRGRGGCRSASASRRAPRAAPRAIDAGRAAPANSRPRKMLSATVSSRDRAELLVDDADAGGARVGGRREGDRPRPSRRIAPALAGKTPARMFISVDLPAPLAPTDGVDLAGFGGEVHMVERQHSGKPAGQPARLQERQASASAGYCGRNSAGRSVANQSSGRLRLGELGRLRRVEVAGRHDDRGRRRLALQDGDRLLAPPRARPPGRSSPRPTSAPWRRAWSSRCSRRPARRSARRAAPASSKAS